MLAELDGSLDTRQQQLKDSFALDKGGFAQIKSAKIENVEEVVDKPRRSALDCYPAAARRSEPSGRGLEDKDGVGTRAGYPVRADNFAQCSKFLRGRPSDHVPTIRQEMGLTTGPGPEGLAIAAVKFFTNPESPT